MYGDPRYKLSIDIAQCSYGPNMRDYLINIITQVLNYPKKGGQPTAYVTTMFQDRIMMVIYPMQVPFMGRSFTVPINIFFVRNFPYEAPHIFLEVSQGSAPNSKNRDIDPNTKRIMTNTLRTWNYSSNINIVLDEIYASFSDTFPIYKVTSKPQAPSYQPQQPPKQNSAYTPTNSIYGNNTGAQGGGGIYNILNNEVQSAYQQQNKYGQYQPPTTSIYGRSMTSESQRGNYPPPNNYDQSGTYQNQNNNNYNPPSSGASGGIYANNNQSNYMRSNTNPEEDLKKALINEVNEKILKKLVEEKKRLNDINKKLKEFKDKVTEENKKIEKVLNDQEKIKSICEEDMSNVNNGVNNLQEYINENKVKTINPENCLTFLDVPCPEDLKIVANEISMEELILLVKRAYERKKIGFEDAISFTRNATRELFAIHFMKNKAINKYESIY